MKSTRFLASSAAAALAAGMATPAFAGELAGYVVDVTDTVALQSAQVRVVELNRVETTERDGSFLITDLPEGSYTIEVRYVGAQTVRRTVEVPASGQVALNFALGDENEILVVGQAATQASSLSLKRESDTIGDALTRDAIGQFPDQNVAESLRRLPGVNILNDQGEGRFVSIRGLDPELNATSLNGVRVPAPEGDVRSVALDVISSDIIESIEIKKSLTPDMDADTIGATIEINTTSAFDRRSDYFAVKAEGSYNDYSGAVTPKGSFDFAALLSPDVGVSGGISFYRREFETDNIEADDWQDEDGLVYAEEVQYRDYDVERERLSASLGFDFRIDDTTELYLRGLYSQFDDQEFRRRTTFTDLDDAFITGTGSSATFADLDGADEYEFTVERDIKDRFESQKIRSLTFGGETDTGGWFAEYSVSWAKSSEREDGSVDPTQFEQGFEGTGLAVMFDYSDPRVPLYSLSGDTTDFFNPAEYELNDIEFTELSSSEDEEYAVRFDIGREFYTDSGTFTVQGGFKGRWREKGYDFNVSFWELDDFTLADVLGEQTYRITDISPVPSYSGHTDYFLSNMGMFEYQETDSLFDSAVEDFSVEEDVMAGYLLGRWDSATLRVIGGLRYENTSNFMWGNDVLLVEEDGTLPDDSIATDDTVLVSDVAFERDYEHWLPSLNIRWEAQDDLVVRLAGYRSLVRPKLSALAPRFFVEQNDDDEREGEFGNPDLLPYEAWNFDGSLEYYFSGNGAISAAVFYKDVSNFIYNQVVEDSTYRGIAFDEAVIPYNGESGEIFGIELSYAQAFTSLPAPFDGLLVQANYTYTDATGLIPIDGDPSDLREIMLPSSSQNTFNVVLGYDKGPFDLRLSGTYRDSYLDEAGDEAAEDRIVDDHFQLDLTAKYRITENIQIFYEWININNAKYFAYNMVGGRINNYQYEEYNWTMKFGARVNF